MTTDSSKPPRLPRLWFLSAEERGIDSREIVPTLPRGTGVIYRDYRNPERRLRARELARLCRRRGLVLLAGTSKPRSSSSLTAGVHVPSWSRRPPRARGLVTLSVHRAGDLRRARASGAHLFIVAPVFRTEAHPEAVPLGPLRLGLLARRLPGPVAALGGITPVSARRLTGLGVYALCGSGLFAHAGAHRELAGLRVWCGPPSTRPQVRPANPRDARRFRTYVRLQSR